MELETGTITVAIISSLILAFGFWIIYKLTDM